MAPELDEMDSRGGDIEGLLIIETGSTPRRYTDFQVEWITIERIAWSASATARDLKNDKEGSTMHVDCPESGREVTLKIVSRTWILSLDQADPEAAVEVMEPGRMLMFRILKTKESSGYTLIGGSHLVMTKK